MKKYWYIIYSIIIIMFLSNSCKDDNIRLFAGKFTTPGEKGLLLFDLNEENGLLKLVSAADAGPNPSYFCISKARGIIYAANEVSEFNGEKGGGVTTLRYNAGTGIIEKINEIVIPDGSPCFISLSAREDYLFLANYTGGSVAVVKLDVNGIPERITDTVLYKGEDGKVSHAHMISADPHGRKVYLTDLGLDRIVIYDFDSDGGQLHQIPNGIVTLPEGSGPRHFVFNSKGSRMYVINELNSTLSVFNVDNSGELRAIQTVKTIDENFNGESFCADIHIGKNGDYLYGSNRGENTIVTFRILEDGTLNTIGRTPCGGSWPRNFVIDPSGKYLIVGNQRSDNISIFSLNEITGLPVETVNGYKVITPACLKFSE